MLACRSGPLIRLGRAGELLAVHSSLRAVDIASCEDVTHCGGWLTRSMGGATGTAEGEDPLDWQWAPIAGVMLWGTGAGLLDVLRAGRALRLPLKPSLGQPGRSLAGCGGLSSCGLRALVSWPAELGWTAMGCRAGAAGLAGGWGQGSSPGVVCGMAGV